MSRQINNALSSVRRWRFAIFYVILFSLNALGTSILAALTGTEWATLDTQQRFMICVAIFVNWTGVLMAFFSKAAKKIEDGDSPLTIIDDGTGNTQTFAKSISPAKPATQTPAQ